MKFRENLSSGKPSCSTQTDGRTDAQTYMMKLRVAFRNFAKFPMQ